MVLSVVAALGLITGSFLNAVIHRLPRGISLLNPRRSFCPECEQTIPWHENLPVVGWVVLRGRCSGCSVPISLRYPLVELLTAALYMMAWWRFGLPTAPVFWVFLSLLVAATFIDFDHLIIPNEITKGGIAVGVVFSSIFPIIHGVSTWWQGLLFSILGALIGYYVLYGVVEFGKIAFGKLRIRSQKTVWRKVTEWVGRFFGASPVTEVPLRLELSASDNRYFIKLFEEQMPLDEFFYRASDRVEASCLWVEVAGERLDAGRLIIGGDCVKYREREWLFSTLPDGTTLRAEASELVLPREAMGFGDVKFLACIGAFLGWEGALFSLFAGSVIGAVIGVAMLVATRGRSGGKIPFGPYLALGAVLWVFAGPELMEFYKTHLLCGLFFLPSLSSTL